MYDEGIASAGEMRLSVSREGGVAGAFEMHTNIYNRLEPRRRRNNYYALLRMGAKRRIIDGKLIRKPIGASLEIGGLGH